MKHTLEEELHIPPGDGQFRDRPQAALGGVVGAEGASWVVYLAILAGWAYIAGLGLGWWRRIPAGWLVLAYAAVLAGKWLLPRGRARRQRGRAPEPAAPHPPAPQRP